MMAHFGDNILGYIMMMTRFDDNLLGFDDNILGFDDNTLGLDDISGFYDNTRSLGAPPGPDF